MFVNSVTLAQFIIFFDAESSFMLTHLLHACSPLNVSFSKPFSSACLALFFPKYR